MENSVLIDQYGRQISYLRLSVTDRCNLRCYYCMPEEGMNFVPGKELLTFGEMHDLSALFCSLGISKIRITGGEPFVRNGIITFLEGLSGLSGLQEITITTNGTLPGRYIARLKDAGIRKLNISIDSLDPQRFLQITRRDSFRDVYACIFRLLREGFEVKLNCVVAAGKNTQDIIPFVELTKEHALVVRFLEEMPFNGSSNFDQFNWTHEDIYSFISGRYPELTRLQAEPNSTSVNYRVPGYKGSFGIIPSFSRTFCGSCNRIRLSATGELRTCLYGPPAVNLRDVLRSGASESEIRKVITDAVAGRLRDGFEAERQNAKQIKDSMSMLGG